MTRKSAVRPRAQQTVDIYTDQQIELVERAEIEAFLRRAGLQRGAARVLQIWPHKPDDHFSCFAAAATVVATRNIRPFLALTQGAGFDGGGRESWVASWRGYVHGGGKSLADALVELEPKLASAAAVEQDCRRFLSQVVSEFRGSRAGR